LAKFAGRVILRSVASPFDSAWLKWGWAVVHAQALDAELRAYAEDPDSGQPYEARTEYDPKRHCVILRLVSVEPLPVKWGLRVGDVANNFRSCLDHIAWTVVHRGKLAERLTKRQERNIYFPIASTKDEFDAGLLKLPGIRVADRAVVRRYQPYVRGKTNLPLHCLTPLDSLTRDDKHRTISPLWAFPESGRLEYGEPHDCTITWIPTRAQGVILEPGAELHRIYVRKTGPNPDVYMEVHLTAQPTINRRTTLTNWMQTIMNHTGAMLREFADPPEDIATLGIITASQLSTPPE